VKRMIACVSLVAAATTAALCATPPPHPHGPAAKTVAGVKAKPKCRVAPADEYFGRLKMSILGIRNVIKDQGLKVDFAPDNATGTLPTMALTEDAVRDWEHKYPCDSWLPGTIYALEHFYTKIHTVTGVMHVHATFAWLRHDYPKAKVTPLGRKEDVEATTVAPNPLSDPPASAAPSPGAAAALGVPSPSAALLTPR